MEERLIDVGVDVGGLSLLSDQFANLGVEVVSCIMQFAFGFVLNLAGRIWRRL